MQIASGAVACHQKPIFAAPSRLWIDILGVKLELDVIFAALEAVVVITSDWTIGLSISGYIEGCG
jgi:hypothetical protein